MVSLQIHGSQSFHGPYQLLHLIVYNLLKLINDALSLRGTSVRFYARSLVRNGTGLKLQQPYKSFSLCFFAYMQKNALCPTMNVHSLFACLFFQPLNRSESYFREIVP